MNQIMVVSAARTPLGRFCGRLEGLSEQQLGAAAMNEAVRRAGIDPSMIDEVIVGIAKQTSKPSNGGRHALLLARLPESIPAYTVQRQSASGLQAVANGCWAIRCGDAEVILAGGTESMSQIPFEIRNARYDFTGERRDLIDAVDAQETGAQPVERYGFLTAAGVAEHLTRAYGFSVGDLEGFAAMDLRRAYSAADQPLFQEEIFPVTVKKGRNEESVDRDELHQTPSLLAPAADGAAMCLLANPGKAKGLGLPVLAEILSVGIAAGNPLDPAIVAVEAGMKAIDSTGLTLKDVDLIALGERSAAECLAIFREWESRGIERELLEERVNPSGGALSTGNPWGAAGAVLLANALYELRRRSGRIGMVMVTAEGGQAMALVLRSHA